MSKKMRVTTQTYVSEQNTLPTGVQFIDIDTNTTTIMSPRELYALSEKGPVYLRYMAEQSVEILPLMSSIVVNDHYQATFFKISDDINLITINFRADDIDSPYHILTDNLEEEPAR